MANKDTRNINDAFSLSDDDDVIEIRSRRKSVTGGGARSSAPRTAQSAPRATAEPARRAEAASRPAAATRSASSAQRPASSGRREAESNWVMPEQPIAPQASRPAAQRQTSSRTASTAPRTTTTAPRTVSTAPRTTSTAPRTTSTASRTTTTASRTTSTATRAANAHDRSAGDASRARSQSERSIPHASNDSDRRRYDDRADAPARRAPASRARKSDKLSVGCIIRRSLLVFGTTLLLVVALVFAVVFVIAHGPSETARNKAVMSAMQASATKWVPGLFLSSETVDKIIEDSKVVVTDVKPITDVGSGEGTASPAASEDRWDKAIDGMVLEFINGKTFKGYVLLIKDPSRVTVGIRNKNDWSSASRIFEIVEQYGAVAAINGGEFPDNGVTTLSNPIGLTYSGGECVWNDGLLRTFMGFTKDNKLIVEEGTTKARADELGIRDAVAFQTGNTLITNDGTNVTYYYADSNTGVAQRTAIGQLADGTVMFLVTDGRTAQSLGATKNDIIDTFIEYGAVTAGMLDGGSSAMLWYRDWYTKYNIDQSKLDDWQLKGLVNVYKAFTNPRAIPSYFIVN